MWMFVMEKKMKGTNVKLAPNSLCSNLIKHLVVVTADDNVKIMNECVHVLTTHFSAGTILGDVVKIRSAIEKTFESKFQTDKARRVFERARTTTERFSPHSLKRAFESALADAARVEGFDVFNCEPNLFDQLLESWSSNDIVGSLDLEDQIFETMSMPMSIEEEYSDDVSSDMLPLVLDKAIDLLENMAADNFGDDPRQVELLRTWANAVDTETFKQKAVDYIKQANNSLFQVSSMNEGIKKELADESKRICEELLYGERSWDDSETLKALLLVLESERVLRKTLTSELV
jgi:FtsZ-binding cell division protein ZapB